VANSRALAVLCAADLLVALDGAVVTVALPAIERDLGASRHDLQWVVTAYTLALGAFLLVGGRGGRSLRQAARARRRTADLRARVARSRPRARHRRPAGGARGAGDRRRARDPGGARPAGRHVPPGARA
jgi:MFS family permease